MMHQSPTTARFDLAKKPRMYIRGSAAAGAFTLTELLIVIGIIVLFVTMALPAFNLISGGKSVAGAENEISALLGRARAEAIGVQDYRGLAIYRDAATDRYSGAIVSFPVFSPWSSTATYSQYSYVSFVIGSGATAVTHYYVSQGDGNLNQTPSSATLQTNGAQWWYECAPNAMDITSDSDIQNFPTGVGVQMMNNWGMTNAGARQSNGYLPMGVILFDGSGVMKLNNVNFATYGHLGTIGSFAAYKSTNLLSIPNYMAGPPAQGLPLTSSFGLVAFDKATFENQGFYPGLPSQLTSTLASTATVNTVYTGNSGEQAADKWLDANSTPLLINRYNGTLVRSE